MARKISLSNYSGYFIDILEIRDLGVIKKFKRLICYQKVFGAFTTLLEREYLLFVQSLERKFVGNEVCSLRQIYERLDKVGQMSFE